jgi:RNA polymerase sigma-54 factor
MMKQQAVQKQQARILPQQIQLLNIFHLTSMELEQRIQQELEENPLLEELNEEDKDELQSDGPQDFADWEEYGYDDIPDYKTEYANFFSDQQMPDRPLAQGADFRAQLKVQLQMLLQTEKEKKLAAFIVDSLNDAGMLDQDLSSVAEDFSFSQGSWVETEELEAVLKVVQSLDPPGLGARNIRECLLLQLERKPSQDMHVAIAIRMIRDHYDALNNRQIEKIMQALDIDEQAFHDALHCIASLQLRPLEDDQGFVAGSQQINPEFIISWEDEHIKVSLTRQKSLQINRGWMETVRQQCHEKDRATNTYLKSKLQSAEWFISSLQQREHSMLAIMHAIVNWQKDYFQEGDPLMLKPMILKNIAEKTGLDMSTISRITSNKYAATPFGNILLKDLFTEGLESSSGESISSRVIQETLREVVDKEDKHQPFTDHELVDILNNKGFRIARRTIAKYRDMLKIPAAKLRALWKSNPTK